MAKVKRKQKPDVDLPESMGKKKQAMLRALDKYGTVKRASQAASIGRRTHYLWMSTDPEYVELVNAIRYELVDFAEDTLKEVMTQREDLRAATTAAIFVAKTLGKDRGYVERQELAALHGGELKINVNIKKNSNGKDKK